jgi:hypothetical protein
VDTAKENFERFCFAKLHAKWVQLNKICEREKSDTQVGTAKQELQKEKIYASATLVGTAKPKLCKKTNRPIVGLVSTDRSVVAALLSTTPRPVTKSSANDLAPQHCTWLFLFRYTPLCSE